MTKAQLLKQQRTIREKLDHIEQRRWIRENKQFVGTYWKYKNNYSCPEKPSDYWWAYRKLISIDLDGRHFLAMTFQIDKYGHIRIERNEYCSGPTHWQPCTETEFEDALHDLKQVVGNL